MKLFFELSQEKKQKFLHAAFYMQMIMLFCYAASARIFFYFERSNSLMFLMVILACALELSIQHYRGKKLYFPISAIIAALSCSLLIDATSAWPYIASIVLAICSKFFITNNGKHYFNPSNFGVVIVLLLYYGNINLSGMIFSGSVMISAIFFIAGLIIALFAGQIFTSLFWVLNFCVIAFIRADFSPLIFLSQIKILGSAAMLLFTFNMITDPRTTPQSLKGKFFYTLSIALIDGAFRIFFIPYGNFYGLFITSALIPLLYDKNKK